MVKWVLGKGEVKILQILKTPNTPKEIEDELMSNRVLNSTAAVKTALKSLRDKNLIKYEEIYVELTDAGKLQRKVLLMTGVITEEPEGSNSGKK